MRLDYNALATYMSNGSEYPLSRLKTDQLTDILESVNAQGVRNRINRLKAAAKAGAPSSPIASSEDPLHTPGTAKTPLDGSPCEKKRRRSLAPTGPRPRKVKRMKQESPSLPVEAPNFNPESENVLRQSEERLAESESSNAEAEKLAAVDDLDLFADI